jgi:hypothetical protein
VTEEQVLASAGLDAFVVGTPILLFKEEMLMSTLVVPVFLQDVHPPICDNVFLLCHSVMADTQSFRYM